MLSVLGTDVEDRVASQTTAAYPLGLRHRGALPCRRGSFTDSILMREGFWEYPGHCVHIFVWPEDARILHIAAIEVLLNHVSVIDLTCRSPENGVDHSVLSTLAAREESFIRRSLIHSCVSTWRSSVRFDFIIWGHQCWGRIDPSMHRDDVFSVTFELWLLAWLASKHTDLGLKGVLLSQIRCTALSSLVGLKILSRCASHRRLLPLLLSELVRFPLYWLMSVLNYYAAF